MPVQWTEFEQTNQNLGDCIWKSQQKQTLKQTKYKSTNNFHDFSNNPPGGGATETFCKQWSEKLINTYQ